MKKRRILKKEYHHALEALRVEKEWVGKRLGEVQTMHERAMRAVKTENGRLKKELAELRACDPSLPKGYFPRTACCDFMLDRRVEGRMPFFRFVCARHEVLSFEHTDKYRIRMEVNKHDMPLDWRHVHILTDRFREMLDFLFKEQQNELGGGMR